MPQCGWSNTLQLDYNSSLLTPPNLSLLMKRILIATISLLMLALAIGVVWFNTIFEEPRAEVIPSLAGHLGAKTILAVFAHPDDETLVSGTLSEAASRDSTRVIMITATKGEAGQADEGFCRQEDLGIIRHGELLKHGYALGIDTQEVWDFPDGGLPDQHDELVHELVARIRHYRPDVVLTFDPASGYTWHPDHREIGRAASVASELAAEPSVGPEAGVPHEIGSLVYLLAPKRMMGRFGGERGKKVASHQVDADYAAPIDRSIKVRGWDIHQSQAGYLRRQWGVPPALLFLFFDKEHFSVQKTETNDRP
jgi:LmbE family N-acetylglucosaminyl deacetylase